MGLISKTVMVKWNSANKKWYESKGYIFTKWKEEFEVKVEDLSNGSHALVNVKCDCCGNIKIIYWYNYNNTLNKYGEYYCFNCVAKLYSGNNANKTKLKNSKSFEQWCVENNRKDILDRWDYILNNYKPSEVLFRTNKKYYFKCPRGIHKSEKKDINHFVSGQEGSINCNQCNSFAQWGIDNLGEDFLEKYWDYEKNVDVNPWNISFASNKKVWIKCQEKDYHDSYDVTFLNFTKGDTRCPYCNKNSGKVHPLDSLGKLLEDKDLLYLWSDNNYNSPYEYAPNSHQEVYWKCSNGLHEDYLRSIKDSKIYNFRCPDCSRERNESFLQQKVRLYLNQLGYIINHEFKCSIIARNPLTNRLMPFDNEIVNLKIIIEVHGKQHYEIAGFYYPNSNPEYELLKLQIRDKYKHIFVEQQGYSYLEIPYWTDDKEETWKKLIDDKIYQVLNCKNK